MSGKRSVGARARAVHKRCIAIDGHNDHLILKYARDKPYDFLKVNRRYHTDGTRLLKGGMTASLFMVGGGQLPRSLALIELAHREIARNPRSLMLVTGAADIRRAKRSGRLGLMLSWESGLALQNNIDVLRVGYRLGVRASTLTHGEGGSGFALQRSPSQFCYCSLADRDTFRRTCKGLTPFGREVVREMNRIGMLVDLAHANDATFEETVKLSTRPVVSTHGGAFACCPHSRCLTDAQIRSVAATGGLLSIAFYNSFLVPTPGRATVESVVDHIAHVADLVGVEHVGIGTDFDGCGKVVLTAERLPELTAAMLRRGFSEAEIRKVWGGNYLRVFKAVMG